jgi:asparagine synthase (glutamine-hydrolysing)
VANAEIYNHPELRRELVGAGARFRSRCDVEVILHGYRRWGVGVVGRLRGMFAFALWDATAKRLLLARDRFGIAPLVYARPGGGLALACASEAKALLHLPGLDTGLDAAALDDYLSLRYVPGPRTLWRGVTQLPPGHRMLVDAAGQGAPECYYRPLASGAGPAPARWRKGGLQLATDALADALGRSVARRRQGDEPVGLYLSGGLDSSLLGAISAAQGHPLTAITHGFDGARDETDAAARAAAAAGSRLVRAPIAASDLDALPAIVRAMEQPVANSDVLGLWALARTARGEVKAVQCGEGADELFGSYPHQQALVLLDALPAQAGVAAATVLRRVPAAALDRLGRYAGLGADRRARERVAAALSQGTLRGRYEGLATLFDGSARRALYHPDLAAAVAASRPSRDALLARLDGGGAAIDRLIDLKLTAFLTDYHLGRENRIAMAHGVEARYPYLDLEVVEAVLPLPARFKVGGRPPRDKRLLRRVAAGLLPAPIARRPKGPVRVPLDLFGGRFEALARDLLSPERVRRRGLLEPRAVAELLDGAPPTSFLASRQLFALVLLELWCEAFG